MQVLSVSSSLLSKDNQRSSRSKIANNSTVTYPQNNNLVDMNYGRSLINNRVSFKGNPGSMVLDLSKKASAAFNSLRSDDLLVVGKDLKTAKKDLKESISLVKDVVNKFIFIEDERFVNTIAIKRNFEGFDELSNLSETPLFVQREGKEGLFFLQKGETAFMVNQDYIHVKKPEYGFTIDAATKETLADFPEGIIKQFDVSKSKKWNVLEINAKNLDSLGVEEVANPATKITFKDVGGQDDAIEEIKKKILFQLKYPNFFKNNKMEGIHSALFVGPPGNGKTLAALATANEAGVPFYSLNAQLLEGKYIGESAENIHQYYENARKNQPCIIFFDEIDAIFKKRTGDHPYLDQSVNMHLDEISRLEKENSQVFLLGATNHPEIMDEGVLRNGRFGTKIEFKSPDTPEKCKSVLLIHTRGTNTANLDVDKFSEKLLKANFSNSDIAATVIEAKMNSIARQGIFDAMGDGTFKDYPDFRLIVKGEDFDKALENLSANKKLVENYSGIKKPIGFTAEK